jgi:hypothetical protein
MIYIHCENLGLLDQLVNTLPLLEATARDFSWRIRLSIEDTSTDKDTTVVEMPQEMALSLFWWYCNKEASNHLSIHLESLLMSDSMKESIVIQLNYSVAQLEHARNNRVFGRVFLDTEAYMAEEIEDHVEYEYETELHALLDAKGFEKFCEVEA